MLWCLKLGIVIYTPWRNRFFEKPASIGWVAPIAFLLSYMMASVIFFGSISFFNFCDDQNICKIGSVQYSGLTLDKFFDLYLWHILERVPGLKITDTLPWEMPLDYGKTPSFLGTLIIIIKIAVILPGIGTIVGYWKQLKEAATDTKPINESDWSDLTLDTSFIAPFERRLLWKGLRRYRGRR